MQIVGTVLCILGIMSMGYLPYIGISESVSLIGVLYAVLCCFSWASEAVIIVDFAGIVLITLFVKAVIIATIVL